jgi:hypothetical protein
VIQKRWIDGVTVTDEEWDRIEAILAARGWASLNRELSRIRVAEEDGQLVAFFVLQLYPHAEPMFIIPSKRGTGLAEELADDMLAYLVEVKARGWMVIASNPAIEKLAEERGMVRLEFPVYMTR